MSHPFTCPAGHHWEAAGNAAGSACPVCGAAGRAPLAIADELPPRASCWAGAAAMTLKIPGHELLEELGRGGMGVVYKARQISLNRLVAVKMIQPELRVQSEELRRFRTEAEAVARLQHPNIVHIYEVGEHAGCRYLLLEYLGGGTLYDKIRNQPQPPDQAAELVETLARAVHAAHQQGIIHRDLKPANVLLTADGTPKIADFGLAKMLPGIAQLAPAAQAKETADDARGPTRSGVIMGTPNYMAPEQARGQVQAIGPATDIYALGTILYELLTGRPPFRSDSPLDTLHQVIAEEPKRPSLVRPGIPRELEQICLRCLQKDPADRYLSAAALADDLRRYRQCQRLAGAASRRSASWLWAAMLGAGVLVILGIVGVRQLFLTAGDGESVADSRGARPQGGAPATSPTGARVSTPAVAGNPTWSILRSLQQLAPEDTFDQIAFPSRWLGCVAGRAGVYRTEDAGQTWQRTWPASWERVHFLTLVDEQRGWLGADKLYETTDGGRSWKADELPVPVRAVTALARGPEGSLLGGAITGSGGLLILRQEPGRTWEALPAEGERGYWGGTSAPYRTWAPSSLAMLSAQKALVVLYNREQSAGVLLQTQDAGRTWSKVLDRAEYLLHLCFIDAQHGWLAGFGGKFWRTQDGGATWQEQANPELDMTASCLAFAPAASPFGIAPLWQGKLLRTRDGATWEILNVDLQGATPSAAVVDPHWLYVLAADGRLARYADPELAVKK